MTGSRAARRGTLGLLAGIVLLAPATAAGQETAPSAQSLLGRDLISLPDRSAIFDQVDRTAGCGDAPEHRRIAVDGRDSDWRGEATMIAGSSRYDAGEWIWTDYPFDDDGTGDFSYPGEGEPLIQAAGTVGKATARNQRYGANAADLVELRAAADSKFVYLLARLNFLNAVDSTVLGLAVDTDGDLGTGMSEWPRGARIDTPGTELFLTLHGTCGFVTTADGEQTLAAAGGAIRTSTRANVIEAAIPRALLDGAARIAVAGGTGLWDPGAARWLAPTISAPGPGGNQSDQPTGAAGVDDPAVFNLLFRDDEDTLTTEVPSGRNTPRTFQTDKQTAALDGGSTGGYRAQLELPRLAAGAAGDPLPIRRGAEVDFTRVYKSRVDTEGVFVSGTFSIFLSRWQPYAIHVPRCYDTGGCPWPDQRGRAGAPLMMWTHGGGGSHLSEGPQSSIAEGGVALYGMKRLYDALDAVVAPVAVRVLARGQRNPWYRGLGEIDPLEVLDDVQRRYAIDGDRKIVSGGSLGGYATLRLASVYPDVFGGAFSHCASGQENAASARITGNYLPDREPFVVDAVMGGLTNVPLRAAVGTADPLLSIVTSHRLRDRALALGLDFAYTEYLLGGHCYDLATGGDPWMPNHAAEYLELLRQPRVADPARVRYAVDPRTYLAAPEPIGVYDVRDLGLTYDRAYWVSELAVRDAAVQRATAGGAAAADVVAEIDAVSHAQPEWRADVVDCGSGNNPHLKPRPSTPSPHMYRCGRKQRAGVAEPVLEFAARHLSQAAFDLARAGIDAARPFALHATGDGPITLVLDGAGGAAASGPCVRSVHRDAGRLVVGAELGASTCVVAVTR